MALLEFPEIFHVDDETVDTTPQGWRGGFSCVLGNPPWERVKLQEKEFFAARHPDIADAPTASVRKELITALERSNSAADQALYREWIVALRVSDGISALIRESGHFPLTATGDINTYAIFAEVARSILGLAGRLGLIIPPGIATDATTQRFFRELIEQMALVSLYDFENEEKLFVDVNNRPRFCLLTLTGGRSRKISLAFRLRQPSQISDRAYEIAPDEILLLNPNTGTCPALTSRRDAEIMLSTYRRVPVLWSEVGEGGNPWCLRFLRMLEMDADSDQFLTKDKVDGSGWSRDGSTYRRGKDRLLPLYEAKMVHHYDHRFSTYEGATQAQINKGTLPRLSDSAHADPELGTLPRYWVSEELVEEKLSGNPGRRKQDWSHAWLLGWRDVARVTEERTFITTAIPRVGVGHKYLLMLPHTGPVACLQANLSAFMLDYVARQKLAGASMSYFMTKQLPVLPPDRYRQRAPWLGYGEDLESWITPRVLEMSFTSYEMQGYARELGDDGVPFVWESGRRMLMRAELEAAFFHLYGVGRDDVAYVMDSFNLVREADERGYGEYRTKRLILEIYDAMRDAMDTGKPYATVLDPPPGQGARHPAREEAQA